jgi:NAD(P)H-hydrate epimerase
VIIDADGINALAENIHILRGRNAPVILTPHPGEMARLTGRPIAEIEADRQRVAMDFAAKHGVVVVLKGHETVIASPDGGLILNHTGNPGLAKGGSGDILAGMIASFSAQGIEPVYAAAIAVFLHGLAADRTAARKSQYAMLPSELLDDLAVILAENGR